MQHRKTISSPKGVGRRNLQNKKWKGGKAMKIEGILNKIKEILHTRLEKKTEYRLSGDIWVAQVAKH